MVDKVALFAAVEQEVRSRLAALEQVQKQARSGTDVAHERPTNRGERAAVTTQGYLAHGAAQRVAELTDTLHLLRDVPPTSRTRVATGALVEVERREKTAWMLVLPGGVGQTLEHAGQAIQVVSPHAPLARALFGLEADEEAELRTPEGLDVVVVLQVR